MLTRQMWLEASLSEAHAVERVEAVVNNTGMVFIGEHPVRGLVHHVDIHDSFEEAKQASIRHLDHRIKKLVELRDAVRCQIDHTILGPSDIRVG